MDINVSQVLAFQRCELDWYYAYVRKRVPRGWSVPLKVGEWWHSLMETYFRLYRDGHHDPIHNATDLAHADMIRLALEANELGFHEQRAEFTKECQKLLSQFVGHWMLRFPPKEIRTIEEPIRRLLPPLRVGETSSHSLIGIPDTVVLLHNRRWHLQHKTASDRTSMPLFVQLAERSLHELAYAWLLEEGEEEYAGTYLNIVRKLSAKAISLNPHSAFVQELIPLRSSQIHTAILDISRIAERMARISSGEVQPIDNREADTNRFGNVISPYFHVKLGIHDLADDSLFTDFVSRYNEPVQ